jgi:hypothetical protein
MSKLYNNLKREIKRIYYTEKAAKMLVNHAKPKKGVKKR